MSNLGLRVREGLQMTSINMSGISGSYDSPERKSLIRQRILGEINGRFARDGNVTTKEIKHLKAEVGADASLNKADKEFIQSALDFLANNGRVYAHLAGDKTKLNGADLHMAWKMVHEDPNVTFGDDGILGTAKKAQTTKPNARQQAKVQKTLEFLSDVATKGFTYSSGSFGGSGTLSKDELHDLANTLEAGFVPKEGDPLAGSDHPYADIDLKAIRFIADKAHSLTRLDGDTSDGPDTLSAKDFQLLTSLASGSANKPAMTLEDMRVEGATTPAKAE
jgi:hypothetical protein